MRRNNKTPVNNGDPLSYKIGSKIIVDHAAQSTNYRGLATIISIPNATSLGYINVRLLDNPQFTTQFTLYFQGCSDRFHLASKEELISHYQDMIKKLEEQITKAKQELEYHKKFANEEEYVAWKMSQMLNLLKKKGNISQEDIQKILEESRITHIL